MDEQLLTAYLRRIGAVRPLRPDLEGLRHLQERQVLSVPFENLGYHLDEPVHMDERVLDKIVRQSRGGGCYEVNPAFAFLLKELGYDVEILPGRVHRPDGLGPAMCHLALRVRVNGTDWLVDTGFGRNSRRPLEFARRDVQHDPDGDYQLLDASDGGIDVLLNGKPLYRLDYRPCRLTDFGPTLWWYRTSPESPFLQDVFCTLRTATGGRLTLRGRTLTRSESGERTVEELPDDDAVLAAYAAHFGFVPDRLPRETSADRRVTAGVQTG